MISNVDCPNCADMRQEIESLQEELRVAQSDARCREFEMVNLEERAQREIERAEERGAW